MYKLIFTLIFSSVLFGCTSVPVETKNTELEQTLERYISTYQARTDFQRFLSFYADDVVLEDMLYGYKVTSKQQLAEFFNWQSQDVLVLNSQHTLSIEQKIVSIEERTAVLRGIFNPFLYHGKQLGPWRFTTVLHFNEQGLIRYQQDWINYYPRSFVTKAPNLNLKR
ncbi:hypothetical protein N473_11360 [Pseudoalteromonas luteoviolacea CPMOR-1]|uniref:SnoaL-like domain-containing protein n=1 Tax=Pseudoalteromonas luteoviolacea CPMOR-1 TaxID=1365248 RepID=A0A167ME25_9GAMM|nr:nuclear transport factor 2 family protein [Pseudoalteromonas luteoviolacea]KZN66159.1 hypothetical protein N473_11360 [Pseudoalteromonas luteoviolacea CPMOR-1]